MILLASTLAATLLLGTPTPSAPHAEVEGEPARLMVLVIVDQMIPEQLDRLDPWFTGGFRRFLDEGEVWRAGAHGHGITETGPGHATVGTGVYPRRHGIVSNGWPALEEKGSVYCAGDDEAMALTSRGLTEIPNEGRSPALLAAPGFSDFLKAQVGQAKCVGVATKDRAAILTMGKSADWSLWWDTRGTGFMSSSCFGDELPPWVREWNVTWTERLMDTGTEGFEWRREEVVNIARAGTAEDMRTGEAGIQGKVDFPHDPLPFSTPRQPNEIRDFASSFIFFSPFADRFTIDMAKRAVVNMELGADEHPDFLFVGLSACDTIGHMCGPYSAETTDLMLKSDRELGGLFDLLDERVGAGRWVAALTADHGVMELPERLQARGIPAKRILGRAETKALGEMREALTDLFGDSFFLGYGGGIRFSLAKAAAAGVEAAELRRAGAEVFGEAAAEEVERAFALDDLLPEPPAPDKDPLLTLMARSAFEGRSPDVLYVRKWGYIQAVRGTTHGSPWAYDRRVPLAFLGPGTTKGQRFEPCLTVDVLPTLFHRAGLAVPEGLDGHVLE